MAEYEPEERRNRCLPLQTVEGMDEAELTGLRVGMVLGSAALVVLGIVLFVVWKRRHRRALIPPGTTTIVATPEPSGPVTVVK